MPSGASVEARGRQAEAAVGCGMLDHTDPEGPSAWCLTRDSPRLPTIGRSARIDVEPLGTATRSRENFLKNQWPLAETPGFEPGVPP